MRSAFFVLLIYLTSRAGICQLVFEKILKKRIDSFLPAQNMPVSHGKEAHYAEQTAESQPERTAESAEPEAGSEGKSERKPQVTSSYLTSRLSKKSRQTFLTAFLFCVCHLAASRGPGKNSSPTAAMVSAPVESSVSRAAKCSAPPAGKAARSVMSAP